MSPAPHYLPALPDHSPTPRPPPPSGDHASLAALLTPVLRETCGGRLSDIQWFRSAWQAGGASTGIASFELRPGFTIEAVVKLPVGPSEFRWTVGLGECPADRDVHDGPTPRVLAAGTDLGGYDLAWMVLERLPGSPLSASLSKDGIEGLLHAAAEWYARAGRLAPLGPDDSPKSEDWAALLNKCRQNVKDRGIAESQRWNDGLKHVQKSLARLAGAWESRGIQSWCHGDLHPGNAMRRAGGAGGADRGEGAGPDEPGRCVLIDLAMVHPGHWVEDALYLERLYWGKPELLFGVKVVSTLARCRRELGLDTGDDYATLANIRRVLMAATVPAFLEHEGHPRYVHAALDMLERLLPIVAR